jgi:hypothetical protein
VLTLFDWFVEFCCRLSIAVLTASMFRPRSVATKRSSADLVAAQRPETNSAIHQTHSDAAPIAVSETLPPKSKRTKWGPPLPQEEAEAVASSSVAAGNEAPAVVKVRCNAHFYDVFFSLICFAFTVLFCCEALEMGPSSRSRADRRAVNRLGMRNCLQCVFVLGLILKLDIICFR